MANSSTFCPGCMTLVGEATEACPRCSYTRPAHGWPADPLVGTKIKDKYLLERRLGAGGFGTVYLGKQVQGDIDLGHVVLKFLHREMAIHESVRRRFINEARAARKVGSPHVVKVFDLDFDEEGMPFMVMEFLKGKSLQEVLKEEGSLSPHKVFSVGLQVAAALQECHTTDIVHRDLKPDNLLLLGGKVDFVKVIDFGIARVPSEDGKVTHTFIGTPRYMPPEQIMQKEIDGGVDIYALGVILFECLTGSPPITAHTPMEYLQANINVTPTPLRELCPELPESLERLLGRMMAKKREDRPASMADVALRLRAIGVNQGWVPEDTGTHVSRPRMSELTGPIDPDEEGGASPPEKRSEAAAWTAPTRASEDLESSSSAALMATETGPLPAAPAAAAAVAAVTPVAATARTPEAPPAALPPVTPAARPPGKPWGVIIGGVALIVATVVGVSLWKMNTRDEGQIDAPAEVRGSSKPAGPVIPSPPPPKEPVAAAASPDASTGKPDAAVVSARPPSKPPAVAKKTKPKSAKKPAIRVTKKTPRVRPTSPPAPKPKEGWGDVSGGL